MILMYRSSSRKLSLLLILGLFCLYIETNADEAVNDNSSKSTKVRAVLGGSIRLPCSTTNPPVEWNHCYTGCSSPSVVYRNGQILNGYKVGNRFFVDTSFARFDLTINDVQHDDAGVYACIDDAGVRHEVTLSVDVGMADLVVAPVDTISAVGGIATLQCRTSYSSGSSVWWVYKRVGSNKQVNIFLGNIGLENEYASGRRHMIIPDESIGQYNLHIRGVTMDDAGTYTCIDRDGLGSKSSAELVVLEEPMFSSDIDTDGVIVDFCENWEPDTIHMSCQVKYHGNIRPTLKWSNNADGSLAIPSTFRIYDRSHGSTLKSNLTVIAQSNIEWHTFLCRANISKAMAFPIGWLNSKVPTLSLCNGSDTSNCSSWNITEDARCTYFGLETSEFNQVGESLHVRGLGKENCIAECIIRNKTCITSKVIDIPRKDGVSEMSIGFAAGVVIGVSVILIVVGVIVRKCLVKKDGSTEMQIEKLRPSAVTVTVKNRLQSNITQVTVRYAESVKRQGLFHRLDPRSVDVELERNVCWVRNAKFDKVLPGGEQKSDYEIFFGNNKGYWQVYFTYEGKEYKIDPKNAEASLTTSGDLTIDILKDDENIILELNAPSFHKMFHPIPVEPAERGVRIAVQNNMAADLDDICLVFADGLNGEFNSSDTDSLKNTPWKQHVKFDNCSLPASAGERQILISDFLKFRQNRHCWQFYFTYEGICYKLKKDHVVFSLKEKDFGKSLNITVCLSKEQSMSVVFEAGGSGKRMQYTPVRLRSVKERNFERAVIMGKIISGKIKERFVGNREKLISILRSLYSSMEGAKNADVTLSLLFEKSEQGGYSKLENSGSEMKRLMHAGPINGESSVLLKKDKYDIEHEEGVDDDVLDLVMDAKLHLQEEHRLLKELRKHVDDIKQLQNGVIDIEELKKHLVDVTHSQNGVIDIEHLLRLLMFGGMTSGSLKIVGIERQELILYIGSLKIVGIERRELMVETGTGIEGRRNPFQLANMLENELKFLNQQDIDNSPATLVLHGEMEKCELIVKHIEDDLQSTAVALQQNKQDVDLANMMLLAGSLVGGVMWCLALFLEQEQVAFEFIGGLFGAGIALLVGCTIGYIGTTLGNYCKKRILFKQLFVKLKPNVDLLTTVEKHFAFLEQEMIEKCKKREVPKELCVGRSNLINHTIFAGVGVGLSVRCGLRGNVEKFSGRGISVITAGNGLRDSIPKLAGRGCVLFAKVAAIAGIVLDLICLCLIAFGFKKRSYSAYKLIITSNDLEYEFRKTQKQLDDLKEEIDKEQKQG